MRNHKPKFFNRLVLLLAIMSCVTSAHASDIKTGTILEHLESNDKTSQFLEMLKHWMAKAIILFLRSRMRLTTLCLNQLERI